MSMAGHGMGAGGGGGQFGSVMRSMRRDESVKAQHVTKGTGKRMFRFAKPYRGILTWLAQLRGRSASGHTFPTGPVRHYPCLSSEAARVVAGAVGKPIPPRAARRASERWRATIGLCRRSGS